MDIFFLPLLLLWRNLDTHFLADLTDPSFCTYGMRTPVVFRSQHKCSVISFFFFILNLTESRLLIIAHTVFLCYSLVESRYLDL